MSGAEMAVTLLIALALVFFVLRPLLKRVLTPEKAPLALPSSAEINSGGSGEMGIPFSAAPMSQLQGGGDGEAAQGERVPAWMNSAKSMGEAQARTLKTVGELVDENPKQAALIVRDWLTTPS